MHNSEEIVKKELESEGWTVFHDGLPDFVCFKDGKVKFVEVKSPSDNIKMNQLMVIMGLKNIGLEAEVKFSTPKIRPKVDAATEFRKPRKLKPRTLCPVCGGQALGPYDYKAMSKSGAYYTYQRYAHIFKGVVTFCHVKVKSLANTTGKAKRR